MRLLALGLLSCAMLAQELTVRPSLRQGDAFELEFVRSREDSRSPQTNGRSRTPVQVRVVEAGPQGFVLDWRQGATSFDNPEIVKNPIAAAAANALKDTRLEIQLDTSGKLSGLRNQAEVLGKLQALRQELLARYSQQADDPQRKQALESLVGRLLSPQALLSAAAADVQNYFSLHGAKLTQGKPVEIPGLRVTLESLDAHEAKIATATIHLKQEKLQASGSGYYIYSRAFGIMNDVVIVRSIAAGDAASRKDTSEIHLVNKPVR